MHPKTFSSCSLNVEDTLRWLSCRLGTSRRHSTVYPPKDWRFQTHKDWRYLWQVAKENCYTKQHREKSLYRFWPQKTISPVQRGNPYKDFFGKPISPILGQSLEVPQHRAHIHVNFKNSKSSHTTTQSPHLGELWKLKVLTRHSTEPTHRGTLKTQSPHTPQHRVYTHGNFKTQSPHTPQHRAHTNGNFENSKSSHATAQSPHS